MASTPGVTNSNQMVCSPSDSQQRLLEKKLQDLAAGALDETSFHDYVDFFGALYAHRDNEDIDFRHSYAGVTNVLYGGETPNSLEQISNAVKTAQRISSNLDQIGPSLEESNYGPRVVKCFNKLSDHVSLEMQRLSVMESVFLGVDSTDQTITDLLKEQQSQFDQQNTKIQDAQDKAENMQAQYITILGVFAAVVLVFNGAISYSTATMSSIDFNASLQSILIVSLLVGFVLTNTVFVLLAFLWKVVAKKDDKLPVPAWIVLAVFDIASIGGFAFLASRCLSIG